MWCSDWVPFFDICHLFRLTWPCEWVLHVDGECLQISPVLFSNFQRSVWHDSTAIRSLDRSYSKWQTNLKKMWCTCRSSVKFSFCSLNLLPFWPSRCRHRHYWVQPCEAHVQFMWKPCETFMDVKHPVKHPVKWKVLLAQNYEVDSTLWRNVWNCNVLFRTEKALCNNMWNIPWF